MALNRYSLIGAAKRSLEEADLALCAPGNNDDKILKALADTVMYVSLAQQEIGGGTDDVQE